MEFYEQVTLEEAIARTVGYRYCEAPHCGRIATVEWVKADEDDRAAGESYIYSTDRCEDHPQEGYSDRPIEYKDGPVFCPRCRTKKYYETIGVCENCERLEAHL